MAKDALIVGPPRSGTSLAASILAGAGYHVGAISKSRYRHGDDHNPFGYFEADDVIERNAAVLARSGFRHHNTWTAGPINRECAGRIGRLVPTAGDLLFVRRYRSRSPWLWKDPRLCFTLPYWWPAMDPARTVVLLVRRDATDVYHSFRRKEWCGAGSAARRAVVELVEAHVAAASGAVRSLGARYVSVDYREYSEDLAGVARRLSEAFELDLDPDDVNFRPELDHSDLRGRLSGEVRKQLKRLPREPVDRLARLLPKRLVAALFPERRYTGGRS